jgi:homoserine dehydrogenase
MLQGDAIREITLEGPGAGGLETASAVVADMISIVGTTGTGFLQNDACWRELERLPRGDLRSPFYFRVEVADQPGVLAHIALRLSQHEVSIARLVQYQRDGGATLHAVTHEARAGSVEEALAEIAALPETQSRPSALPVISSRGVTGAGWT